MEKLGNLREKEFLLLLKNELVQALFDYVYSAEGDDLIKSVGLITTK